MRRVVLRAAEKKSRVGKGKSVRRTGPRADRSEGRAAGGWVGGWVVDAREFDPVEEPSALAWSVGLRSLSDRTQLVFQIVIFFCPASKLMERLNASKDALGHAREAFRKAEEEYKKAQDEHSLAEYAVKFGTETPACADCRRLIQRGTKRAVLTDKQTAREFVLCGTCFRGRYSGD